MKFGTPPPPQDVIMGNCAYLINFGGGGCVKRNDVGYERHLFNLITPTYGKVGDF